MLLNISHTTQYHYDEPVQYSLHQLRLTPKSNQNQRVVNWQTTITGGEKQLEFIDQHNNHVDLISFNAGESEISIHSWGEVETTDTHGIVGKHGGYAPLWYFKSTTELTQPGGQVKKLVKTLGDRFNGDIERMHALSSLISEQVSYKIGETHAATTVEEALNAEYGVCQDHAHIFSAAARLMGYPARYVSGYLLMDGRVDQDATHAWAEAYLPELGWVGFDVSNNICPDERYVRVATGLDYRDAAPISGVRYGSSGETMIVSLQVQQ
ncbi:transglutaminase family protein [Sneathiella sp.]|jgi:transglutaminase-like putative cysteine protease|uniref:transglutaminase family protein n=1 Tax=Sneathiella sp. TaxID=1964365 RepID=UPI0039E683B1